MNTVNILGTFFLFSGGAVFGGLLAGFAVWALARSRIRHWKKEAKREPEQARPVRAVRGRAHHG